MTAVFFTAGVTNVMLGNLLASISAIWSSAPGTGRPTWYTSGSAIFLEHDLHSSLFC